MRPRIAQLRAVLWKHVDSPACYTTAELAAVHLQTKRAFSFCIATESRLDILFRSTKDVSVLIDCPNCL